jgi:hypothetical protein
MSSSQVVRHLAAYEDVLLQMHAYRVEAGGGPTRWNRLVHRLQEHHLALRDDPQGRDGISRLIDHDVSTVRQWAATHALFWDEPAARAELERQAAGGASLVEFEAKMVLQEFDAGRLDTAWTPKRH